MSWVATGNQTFNRSYTYDSLNRLSTMADSASAQPCKGLTWGYDAWGNRTDQNLTSGSCNTFHASVDTNNRLTGSPYSYDAAGNMTHDGSHSYTYDAEGHLATVDGGSTASYVYDASGLRVQKTVAGTPVNYLYDLSGKTLVEISGSGSVISDYAYLGGQFVAEYSAGTTYFVHQDHLGSARLMTRLDKSIYDSLDYLPYGEQIAGATGTTHKFTSDERDGTSATETGLDHTQFRQYSSFIGRWTIPDPADLAAANLAFPQSWNRYAYVLNNPLANIDPLGLCDGQGDYPDLPCPGDNTVTVNGGDAPTYLTCDGIVSSSPGCVPQSYQPWLFPPSNGGGASGGGGAGSKVVAVLKLAVRGLCSTKPDVITGGGGVDLGLGMAGGFSGGYAANGASGQVSLTGTVTWNFGLIAPDAYAYVGAVFNAPTNADLNSTIAKPDAPQVTVAGERFGVTVNPGGYQITAGPSISPVTVALGGSVTKTTPSLPYVGYLANPERAVCRLITGH